MGVGQDPEQLKHARVRTFDLAAQLISEFLRQVTHDKAINFPDVQRSMPCFLNKRPWAVYRYIYSMAVDQTPDNQTSAPRKLSKKGIKLNRMNICFPIGLGTGRD